MGIEPGDLITCDTDVLRSAELLRLDGTEPYAAELIANNLGKEVHEVQDSLLRLREVGMLEAEQMEE